MAESVAPFCGSGCRHGARWVVAAGATPYSLRSDPPCSFLPWGQRFGAEVYGGGNPGFNLRKRTHVSMADIARQLNPLLRGDCALRSIQAGASGSILRYVNQTIEAWMVRKFKHFMGSQGQDRPRSRTTISRTSRVVRAMEDRHTRLVRLMGA